MRYIFVPAMRALLLVSASFLLCMHHAQAKPSGLPRLLHEENKRLHDLNVTRKALAQPDVAFANFLVAFNKTWSSDEMPHRFDLFRQALDIVNRSHADFEAGNATIWLKITPFADLTPEEFLLARVRGLQPTSTASEVDIQSMSTRRELLQSLPASVDWRSASFGSAVTPVQNQGQCNDCWAFASAAAVEASAAIRFQTPAVALSEQQVLNCAPTSGGCTDGNTLPGSFSYYIGPGVTTEANFPYTSSLGYFSGGSGCSSVPTPLVNISLYLPISSASPSALQAATAISVPAVAICSATLQYYGGGLLTSQEGGGCSGCNTVDHAVAIVGYDTTPSGAGAYSTSTQNYWIVKNSWGTEWGDNGYAYVAMSGGLAAGRSGVYGPCNILQESYYVPPSAVSETATLQAPGPSASQTGSGGISPSDLPSPPDQAAGRPPHFSMLLCILVFSITAVIGLL